MVWTCSYTKNLLLKDPAAPEDQAAAVLAVEEIQAPTAAAQVQAVPADAAQVRVGVRVVYR